jgi:cell wall-associated NlpC family hydrolase
LAKQGISGTALAVAAGGAFLVYVGIKGSNPIEELRSILRGEAPPSLSRTPAFQGFAVGEAIAGIASVAGANAAVLNAGQKYLGVPYRWGGSTRAGMDCSGLCWRAAKDTGSSIARFTTATIALSSQVVKINGPAAPGDFVVWPGDHMGINVDGTKMLNAPHTGAVVRYDDYSRRSAPLVLRLKVPKSSINDSVPGGRGGV